MTEILVKLPETLHVQLDLLAQQEGVSINQYILYSLTRQVASGYALKRTSANQVQQQQDDIEALRAQWRALAADKDVTQLLAERDAVEPEPELTPDLVAKLREKIMFAQNPPK
jgi:hypothetical protein